MFVKAARFLGAAGSDQVESFLAFILVIVFVMSAVTAGLLHCWFSAYACGFELDVDRVSLPVVALFSFIFILKLIFR